MERTALSRPIIEWGVAHHPCEGEIVSGDAYLVKSSQNGALVGVVDGLGHGAEAAVAASTAIATLESSDQNSVIPLVRQCHERLTGTRGVVMSLALFQAADHTMTWLGVGNVEGAMVRSDTEAKPGQEHILLRGGVVGFNLPWLHASILSLAYGDTLFLATDGIRPDFVGILPLRGSPQQQADQIMHKHRRETDDALVLVARYTG